MVDNGENAGKMGGRTTDQTAPKDPNGPEGGAEQVPMSAAVPTQGEMKAKRSSPRPDVSYTPVSNGMDYLVSVFQHLMEGAAPPSARDLKYTVLHLQAASEGHWRTATAARHAVGCAAASHLMEVVRVF